MNGLSYFAWDVWHQLVIAAALEDLSDSSEATDEYLRLLVTQWIPHMYKIHDPHRYGLN